MNNSSVNILAWYDTKAKQDHRRWWSFGHVQAVVAELDHIPAFQMVRDQTGAAINLLKLVKLSDDSETDILSEAQTVGLEVATFSDYDLIIYPDVLHLGLVGVEMGAYYLKMSDGTNTWYSDVFGMFDDVSTMIKIEYWHNEDFSYPGGHIRYNAPFKSRLYIPSDIGKPKYEYEEQVIKNSGYNFPTQQISFKKFQFDSLLPEFICDAARLIGLHDSIEIMYSGRTYTVDEFLMTDPVWQEQGNVAKVGFEFRTDTVVSINGRGVIDSEYLPTAGSCVLTAFSCVAEIEEFSDHYTNFTYTNSLGGTSSFDDGDYLVMLIGAIRKVYQYNSSSYAAQTVASGDNVFNETENNYLVGTGGDAITKPYISYYDANTGLFYATGLSGAVHSVYSVSGGVEALIGNYTFAEVGGGITINYESTFDYLRLKIASAACGIFQQPKDYLIAPPTGSGIGSMTIGSTNIVG